MDGETEISFLENVTPNLKSDAFVSFCSHLRSLVPSAKFSIPNPHIFKATRNDTFVIEIASAHAQNPQTFTPPAPKWRPNRRSISFLNANMISGNARNSGSGGERTSFKERESRGSPAVVAKHSHSPLADSAPAHAPAPVHAPAPGPSAHAVSPSASSSSSAPATAPRHTSSFDLKSKKRIGKKK